MEPEADPFALPVGMDQYQADMERGLDLFMDLAEVCMSGGGGGGGGWGVSCGWCGAHVVLALRCGAIDNAREAAWGELLWVIVPFAAHVHH